MKDLLKLIEEWETSALSFREAETLINLLIIDNKRLEQKVAGFFSSCYSDGRCVHCGSGDDDHHSYTCPTNLHPDKRNK